MSNPARFVTKHQSGAMSPAVLLVVVAAIIGLSLAVYFLFMKKSPVADSPIADAPVTTPVERGDSARETVAELKADTSGTDYAGAYEQGKKHHAAGELADAQILYFFAAKGGYAPAMFELATLYDPALGTDVSSVTGKPDAFQAYKWYKRSRDAGYTAADQRITALKDWAENAARDGDAAAERLILQWE